MPSRRDSLLVPGRRAATVYAAGVAVISATWLFGFALRVPVWSADIRMFQRPFMSATAAPAGWVGSFDGGIQALVNCTLLVALASAAYIVCLLALRRGFAHSYAAAVAGTAIAALAILPMVPQVSPDATHLAADVRTLWLHGKYPTDRDAAPASIDDPVAQQVGNFKDSWSGYGPVAYAIGGAPLPFVGDNLRANVLGQKAVSGVFLVLLAAASGFAARRLGRDPGLVAGMVGLNPLMLFVFPGDGHNDTIMMAFAVAGLPFVLALPWRSRAGGLLAGLAGVLAKFAAALAAPFVAAAWFPKLRYLIAAACLLALVGFSVALMTRSLPRVTSLGPALAFTRMSIWSTLPDADPGRGDFETRRRLAAFAYTLFGVILAAVIARHRLKTPLDVVTAAGATIWVFVFALLPGYLPWYQVWYFPFAAISGRRWLVAASMAFSIGAFLPIFALQWAGDIQRVMQVSDPHHKAVWTVFVVVAGLAVATWYYDRVTERRLQMTAEERARRAKRTARNKPLRARR
ncbi:MAG: hypothetical protein HY875_02905 [Chloroflexi bacterium]|nr:hypothetical protein [Chloroflexota bacterium]